MLLLSVMVVNCVADLKKICTAEDSSGQNYPQLSWQKITHQSDEKYLIILHNWSDHHSQNPQ